MEILSWEREGGFGAGIWMAGRLGNYRGESWT